MSTSPREGSANAGSSNGLEEKPRLSEHEKKANHIASEQKRRQAIREGFDRLTELVPGLEGQGRSESVVLKKTVDYMRAQLEERRRLVGRLDELGGHVEDEMRR
ncbi:helix-loop-helix DNA-binding domain-containing protein [Hyaloscypha hepaticicola]|uniref:Helix-loop-helix DNA-binding domain-containing protein n=1 Tax=Hyaloscypha hepaticicola TaxID=2082293 RepID=A0A2J6Q447_9HELO|nr:helix-loop-helix DNA-binding domain-containing protein [Hyaloscypha hepaticicola]